MKIHGNQQNQGLRQTIDWVKQSIDTQLDQAKNLGAHHVDKVQHAFEQRLGSDRFARSQHSGLDASGMDDMAQRAAGAHKRRRRGRLTQGLGPDSKHPEPPRPDDEPGRPIRDPVQGFIKPGMVARPDIIQVPNKTNSGASGTSPIEH